MSKKFFFFEKKKKIISSTGPVMTSQIRLVFPSNGPGSNLQDARKDVRPEMSGKARRGCTVLVKRNLRFAERLDFLTPTRPHSGHGNPPVFVTTRHFRRQRGLMLIVGNSGDGISPQLICLRRQMTVARTSANRSASTWVSYSEHGPSSHVGHKGPPNAASHDCYMFWKQ